MEVIMSFKKSMLLGLCTLFGGTQIQAFSWETVTDHIRLAICFAEYKTNQGLDAIEDKCNKLNEHRKAYISDKTIENSAKIGALAAAGAAAVWAYHNPHIVYDKIKDMAQATKYASIAINISLGVSVISLIPAFIYDNLCKNGYIDL